MNELAPSVLKWAARRGYERYTLARLDRVLRRAAEEGLSESELTRSEERFALFVRLVRALEQCSNSEVTDYIAQEMIGTFKSGDIDKRPDFAQMAISSLSGVTKVELDIIVYMHKNSTYQRNHYEVDDIEKLRDFYSTATEELGIESSLLNAILNGLSRTGLVTPPASGFGAVIAKDTCRLTPLARELFRYIDYKKRLTT